MTLFALDGRITNLKFAVLLSVALAAEFLLSLEIFATMTMFGGLALLFGWSFGAHESRIRIQRMIIPIVASYIVALIIVSPYLYYLFAYGFDRAPFWGHLAFDSDPLNLIIPTPTTELGRLEWFRHISQRFPGGSIADADAYFGLPLIFIAAAFARRRWREPAGKMLVELLIIICMLSLGSRLHVYGQVYPFALPWFAFAHLPVINSALPVRFSMYADLVLAIIVALWVAQCRFSALSKIAIACIILISLAPNSSAAFWTRRSDVPLFFSNGLYRRYLHRNETVLPLPYGMRGDSMLWLAETGMHFRMAGGWTGPTPPAFERWPIVPAMIKGTLMPDAREQLAAFLGANNVSAIVVDDRDMPAWRGLLSSLGVAPLGVGGITLYRLARQKAPVDVDAAAEQMQLCAGSAQFAALAVYANKYLSDGGDGRELSPFAIEPLIPQPWIVGPTAAPDWIIDPSRIWWGDLPPNLHNRLWLGSTADGAISIGVAVKDESVRPMVEKYGGSASAIYYPYPRKFDDRIKSVELSLLVMNFNRERLHALAAQITASPEWASYTRPPLTQSVKTATSEFSR
ncbi:MAG: hypothetical protein ACREQN_12040 [Candidatus Binataceae bacterium]